MVANLADPGYELELSTAVPSVGLVRIIMLILNYNCEFWMFIVLYFY